MILQRIPREWHNAANTVVVVAISGALAWVLSPIIVALQLQHYGIPALQSPPPSMPLTIVLAYFLVLGVVLYGRRDETGFLLGVGVGVLTLALFVFAAPHIPRALGGIRPFCGEVALREPLSLDLSSALGLRSTGDTKAPYRSAPQQIVDVGDGWLRLRPAGGGPPLLLNWSTVPDIVLCADAPTMSSNTQTLIAAAYAVFVIGGFLFYLSTSATQAKPDRGQKE